MKNLMGLFAGLLVFSSVTVSASETGVYQCLQVDAGGSKPLSLYIKVTHELKELEGNRAKDTFDLVDVVLNLQNGLVKIVPETTVEFENDFAQFSKLATADQPAVNFSLSLKESRSLVSLTYGTLKVENAWFSCKLAQ